MTPRSATARACANVALVKYWGKRDEEMNLPATGSISLTLAELTATARVFPATAREPRFLQDRRPVEGVPGRRMVEFLDLVATRFGGDPLAVEVVADFPVAAGLASSAAIFAETAAAGAAACEGRIDLDDLSALARRGSGSASRSIHGGFVEWARGDRDDGSDSVARPLLPAGEWDLAMAVAVVSEAKKDVGSRDAMGHVARTSPLYAGWLAAQDDDLESMRVAIDRRDLERVGTIAEENCLRMHATAIAARPPILYWAPATLEVMSLVRRLRGDGLAGWFTIDAGPQVKVLCAGADLDAIAARLAEVPGVSRVIKARPGDGVRMLEGPCPWS
ncbi:MAG: diphosphomevalonate decarboxylase [Alphaproteobacteria bacterium]